MNNNIVKNQKQMEKQKTQKLTIETVVKSLKKIISMLKPVREIMVIIGFLTKPILEIFEML
jgi:hypothetical protein